MQKSASSDHNSNNFTHAFHRNNNFTSTYRIDLYILLILPYTVLKGSGGGIKKKNTSWHRQQHGNYQREMGWGEVEEDKSGINGNGMRQNLIKLML